MWNLSTKLHKIKKKLLKKLNSAFKVFGFLNVEKPRFLKPNSTALAVGLSDGDGMMDAYSYSDWQQPDSVRRAIRYDTRCCVNVRSTADMSQLNPPHGINN